MNNVICINYLHEILYAYSLLLFVHFYWNREWNVFFTTLLHLFIYYI